MLEYCKYLNNDQFVIWSKVKITKIEVVNHLLNNMWILSINVDMHTFWKYIHFAQWSLRWIVSLVSFPYCIFLKDQVFKSIDLEFLWLSWSMSQIPFEQILVQEIVLQFPQAKVCHIFRLPPPSLNGQYLYKRKNLDFDVKHHCSTPLSIF